MTQYIKYTHVDAVTGIPVTEAPAVNGPAYPAVAGLQFEWALESQYPTPAPIMFGTCDDGAVTDVPGVLAIVNQAEYAATWEAEQAARLAKAKASLIAAINAERDRRETAGFPYQDRWLDADSLSVQRITAAALAAQGALAAGQPFSLDWTCADNSVLALDVAGVIGMPVALAMHAAALHSHARTLKSAVEAAADQAALAGIEIQAGWPEAAA